MEKAIADRYIPEGASSKGGMGQVSIYNDRHLDRKVIIKELLPDVESRRLVDELRSLAQLRSKHVVQLFDLAEIDSDGLPNAIVLEYIDGSELVPGSMLPDTSFLKISYQIACGILDIHSLNIVHRDLKPNNIMIDSEGVVKIIDFGLSRNQDEAVTKGAVGTPVFMAPELWKDSTVTFDYAVDVYAFGLICFILLDGSLPDEVRSFPPQPIPKNVYCAPFSGLPAEVIDVFYQCVSFDPGLRPKIGLVQELVKKHILKDSHRATVVMDAAIHELNSNYRKMTLSAKNVGVICIYYDGHSFLVDSCSGQVFLNNSIAQKGQEIPGCCVITFGSGPGRRFVTFDVSNPEVVL